MEQWKAPVKNAPETNAPVPETKQGRTAGEPACLLSGEAGGTAAPLSREECLALAAVVLAADARPDSSRPETSILQESLAAAADRIPALASWLLSRPASSPVSTGSQRNRESLARLAAAVVLPGEARYAEVARDAEVAGRAGPSPEATVLREAVLAALAHAELRERFDRALTEARLDAMRELAYGAGHEINNPLANIATRAQALLLDESDPERRRRLASIVDQSFRARDMIGGLMLFARPPKPRREAVDVGGLAAAAIEAVQGQAKTRGVRLEYCPLPQPATVFVDRVQVEEAIRIVVVNAIEAVAAGGRVVLEVARQVLPGGPSGPDWCEMKVADDGRGMSAETARRAFDPFFSGREAGRGIGLGLSKAWRLIELSGGRVTIDSRPGQGTRVSILLPSPGG